MPVRRMGWGSEKGRQKERTRKNSDVRCVLLRSRVWDARSRIKHGRLCGNPHKKGRGEWRLILSSHGGIGGKYKRNGAVKGKSCRDEGAL